MACEKLIPGDDPDWTNFKPGLGGFNTFVRFYLNFLIVNAYNFEHNSPDFGGIKVLSFFINIFLAYSENEEI
jgi:hypothetical protein